MGTFMVEEILGSDEKWSLPGTDYKFVVYNVRNDRGNEFERGIHYRPDGVGILPLRDDGHVILIWQHEQGAGKKMIKIAGGGLDNKEESFETAAHREVLQETGYAANNLEFLYSYSGDAVTKQKNNYYLATGLYIPESKVLEDQFEPKIKIHTLPFQEALRCVLRNPDASSAAFRMMFMTLDRIVSNPKYAHLIDKIGITHESRDGLKYLFDGEA